MHIGAMHKKRMVCEGGEATGKAGERETERGGIEIPIEHREKRRGSTKGAGGQCFVDTRTIKKWQHARCTATLKVGRSSWRRRRRYPGEDPRA